MATLAAGADDPITIGGRACNQKGAADLLGHRLKALPEKVRETRRLELGTYRGLDFGIVLHPLGAPDAYLEGAILRHTPLSRDSHGPRAVLNALDRLASGYEGQCASARQDFAISQGQLRDYEVRLGQPFAHDGYLAELTGLRDQLKLVLSGTTSEPRTAPLSPTAELAERIKALKSAHSIDAAPQRAGTRRTSAGEEPVTARIHRRIDMPAAPEPVIDPEFPLTPTVPLDPVTASVPAGPVSPSRAEPVVFHLDTAPPAPARPRTAYRKHVARDKRARQLSLF
jgi:hypothetical protein